MSEDHLTTTKNVGSEASNGGFLSEEQAQSGSSSPQAVKQGKLL